MENQIIVWEDEKQVAEIRKIICSTPLTDIEFATFTGIAKSTQLNPFLREIWAVKYGNNPASIFVGRDGYRKSAQAHRDYDYHQVDAVYSKDEFSVHNGEVHHQYSLADRGVLVGAYAVCQRKGSTRANYVYVPLKEYNSGKSLWTSKPETMIKKVAEAQVLRMTFQELFAGTYDESENWTEAPAQESAPAHPVHTPKAKEVTVTNVETGEVETVAKISNKTRADIVSSFKKLAKLAGWTSDEQSSKMTAYLNRECKNAEGKPIGNILFISEEQAQKMLEYINDKIAAYTPPAEPKDIPASNFGDDGQYNHSLPSTEEEKAEAVSATEAEAVFEEVEAIEEPEVIDVPFDDMTKYKSLSEVMMAELDAKKKCTAGEISEDRKKEILDECKRYKAYFLNKPE